jgi:hypothetical protein
MKIKIFYSMLSCLLFFSCDGPTVLFEHPQPLDVKDMDHFPKSINGQYLSLADSSVLTITDKAIARGFNIKYVMCKKELDTMKYCTLIKDTLFNKQTNEKICVVTINDTLYTPYHLQDTLFYISDKNILRKDKGYYFLSMQFHKGWEVQKLEYTGRRLCLCSIANMEEIENLKAITDADDDSLFQFDPDKKQLRKFLKSKGFGKKEEFVKLK